MGGLAGTAAKLLASLDLDTRGFEAGAKRVGGAMGKMESRFGKMGSIAKRGVGNLATNLTRIGVVAAGAIAVAVKSGIQSLADLERVQNATAGVIESTGGAAGVSAVQIRAMAEALEQVTTADDKVIQGGQNLLLTFTGIGKDVFPQATKAMVDMGIAMAQGDVANADFKASAIQIGKALQDPIKGATALRRVGVMLTDQQQKQIAKFVESGDIMSAQKVILQELEVEFGKAGEAAGKGFGGDLRRLDDAFEDSRMALATGFLPVIRKVADKLSTELVKPEVQKQIQDFGITLAGAFDKVLEIGGKLPWAQIGDSLKIAGAGAKAVFDAFAGLPPWIQTAVLTGWGLNKLSGGALTGLAGEAIKIGFSQFAGRGATPANPLWVASAQGGLGGGAAGAGAVAAGGRFGGLLNVVSKVLIVGMVAEVASMIAKPVQQLGTDLGRQIPFLLKEREALGQALFGTRSQGQMNRGIAPEQRRANDKISTGIERLRDIALQPPPSKAELAGLAKIERKNERVYSGVEKMRGELAQDLAGVKSTVSQKGSAMVSAERSAADRIVAAINRTTGAVNGIDMNAYVTVNASTGFTTGTSVRRTNRNPRRAGGRGRR